MSRLSSSFAAKKNFDNARKRLAENLSELEEALKIRINQEIAEAKAMEDEGNSDSRSRYSELKLLNIRLTQELKTTQKNLAEIGKDNLFLHEKSKFLASRISDFKVQGVRVVEQIEQNLEKIEKLVKNHDD